MACAERSAIEMDKYSTSEHEIVFNVPETHKTCNSNCCATNVLFHSTLFQVPDEFYNNVQVETSICTQHSRHSLPENMS